MNNPGDSIIVELIVTNDFECTADTTYMSFYNWKQPDVSFSVDDVCWETPRSLLMKHHQATHLYKIGYGLLMEVGYF